FGVAERGGLELLPGGGGNVLVENGVGVGRQRLGAHQIVVPAGAVGLARGDVEPVVQQAFVLVVEGSEVHAASELEDLLRERGVDVFDCGGRGHQRDGEIAVVDRGKKIGSHLLGGAVDL